ncbi:hypothetical protein D3C87_1314410 [compost metagenome]
MKKLLFVLVSLILAACGDDGGGGGTTAKTPLELQCINGQANCNNSGYNQYPGWSSYPYQNGGYNYVNYFAQNGFCNCPYGTMPAYNGTMGLGCVRNTYVNMYAGAYFYWNFGNLGGYAQLGGGYGYNNGWNNGYSYPGSNYPSNYQQYSNVNAHGNYGWNNGGWNNGGGYGNSSCTQNLAQSCYVNIGNSCGNGLFCRQTVAGSNLGICTR